MCKLDKMCDSCVHMYKRTCPFKPKFIHVDTPGCTKYTRYNRAYGIGCECAYCDATKEWALQHKKVPIGILKRSDDAK